MSKDTTKSKNETTSKKIRKEIDEKALQFATKKVEQCKNNNKSIVTIGSMNKDEFFKELVDIAKKEFTNNKESNQKYDNKCNCTCSKNITSASDIEIPKFDNTKQVEEAYHEGQTITPHVGVICIPDQEDFDFAELKCRPTFGDIVKDVVVPVLVATSTVLTIVCQIKKMKK